MAATKHLTSDILMLMYKKCYAECGIRKYWENTSVVSTPEVLARSAICNVTCRGKKTDRQTKNLNIKNNIPEWIDIKRVHLWRLQSGDKDGRI